MLKNNLRGMLKRIPLLHSTICFLLLFSIFVLYFKKGTIFSKKGSILIEFEVIVVIFIFA
jgi:hypothetical protein